MAISDRNLSKRVKKLGASNVEPVKETALRQTDMLRRLEEAAGGPTHEGLYGCRLDYCGLVHCSRGCWFNIRLRRLNDVLAAHKMLRALPGPFHEVRIVLASWQRPIGKLSSTNIQTAKQFVRRRLDTRNGREAIMVESYKVAKDPYDTRWIGEIHAVVCGLEKLALRRALRVPIQESDSHLYVEEVRDLPNTLVEVLRLDVCAWQPLYAVEPMGKPRKKQRGEFYRWLLRRGRDEQLFRYGCDQHFRPIIKKPRPIVVKPKKKRPYPEWLARFMYGSHPHKCRCKVCEGQANR
jgi:hypothetical protein